MVRNAVPFNHSNLRSVTPMFHSNMKWSAKVRRSLGDKTINCVPTALYFWLMHYSSAPKKTLDIKEVPENLLGVQKDKSRRVKTSLPTTTENIINILDALKEMVYQDLPQVRSKTSGYSIEVIKLFCELAVRANMYVFDRNDQLIASVDTFKKTEGKKNTTTSPLYAYATNDHFDLMS